MAAKPKSARSRGPDARHGARVRALSSRERDELRWAYEQLEHPSFAARLSSLIGAPIERGLRLMPRRWFQGYQAVAEVAVRRALDVALASLGRGDAGPAQDAAHRLLACASGAAAGFLGPLAVLAEMPLATVLMLRSIAQIARDEGEDLAAVDARLACVEVFALGGRSHRDDASDTGYYGLRVALAFHFYGALEAQAAGRMGIPFSVNAVRAVAARFGVVVSDKAAAQSVPLFGAATGALVNLAFMQHFQDVARGHFILRRLERRHGMERIRRAYAQVEREAVRATREFSRLEGW